MSRHTRVESKQRCRFSRSFAEVRWAIGHHVYSPPVMCVWSSKLVGQDTKSPTRGQQMISVLSFVSLPQSCPSRNKHVMLMGGVGPSLFPCAAFFCTFSRYPCQYSLSLKCSKSLLVVSWLRHAGLGGMWGPRLPTTQLPRSGFILRRGTSQLCI